MGFKDGELTSKYVQFEGLDVDPTGTPYGSSIATEKALDPNHSILIAYEMNGEWGSCLLATFNVLLFVIRYH